MHRDKRYRRYQEGRAKTEVAFKFRDVLADYEHRNDDHRYNYTHRKADGACYMDEPHWLESYIGRTASHNHSCGMCGNPRKWNRERSRDQLLADIDFEQQLADISPCLN